MSKYVVVRPSAGLPVDYLPDHLDGKWYDMEDIPMDYGLRPAQPGQATVLARPTGRFEYREDGQAAEVYEVSP